MPVPTLITDLSTSAGSNSPSGSETPIEGDNHLRAAYSFIAQLRDQQTTVTNQLNGTATGVVLKSASTTTGFTIGSAAGDALTINSQAASIPNGWNLTGGNVYLGTKVTGYDAANRTHITVNGTSSSLLGLAAGGTRKGFLFTDGTVVTVGAETGVSLNINAGGNTVSTADGTTLRLKSLEGYEYGFRDMPFVDKSGGTYNLVQADANTTVYKNDATTFGLLKQSSTAMRNGTTISLWNNTGSAVTCNLATGVSVVMPAGVTRTGSFSLRALGLAVLTNIAGGDFWVLRGDVS